MTRRPTVLLLLCLIASTTVADDPPSPTPLQRWSPRLLEIAKSYRKLALADDAIRVAPTLCDADPTPAPRASKAKAGTPHARKVYRLFVKQLDAYAKMSLRKKAPVGQLIVKETWQPKLAGKDDWAITVIDGKGYVRGAQKELFVMFKVADGTPDSDKGWVYGTLTADGKKVLHAGKMTSCISCHVNAPHDRQYGLKILHEQAKEKKKE